jgi:hypothetical protein
MPLLLGALLEYPDPTVREEPLEVIDDYWNNLLDCPWYQGFFGYRSGYYFLHAALINQ